MKNRLPVESDHLRSKTNKESGRTKLCSLLGFLSLFQVSGASALPILSVDLEPATPGVQSTTSVLPGASFGVNILISDVDASAPDGPLQGFEFDLDFDPAILSATGVVNGGFVTGSVFTLVSEQDIVAPDVNLAVTAVGTTTGVGAGILASLTFDVIGIGDALLALNDVKLAAPFGVPIGTPGTTGFFDQVNPANINNGVVSVASAPIPGTVLLLGLGLAGISGIRKRSGSTV